MCRFTSLRMSVMARCAATPRSCESANDVEAWRRVARPAAAASGTRSSPRLFPMTSSMRYFEEAGRTSPASRPIAIMTKPRARRYRRAQTTSRASRQTTDQEGFSFPSPPGAGREEPRVRSALRSSLMPVNYSVKAGSRIQTLETETIHGQDGSSYGAHGDDLEDVDPPPRRGFRGHDHRGHFRRGHEGLETRAVEPDLDGRGNSALGRGAVDENAKGLGTEDGNEESRSLL